MKYFTSDLWSKINSTEEHEREIADKQWQENGELYAEYFAGIKEKLPVNFLKIYNKCYGFHD